MNTKETISNAGRCPHFHACNQGLCPLDLELNLRVGGDRDKCRFMREAHKMKIKGREFLSGGRVMPNDVLNFVPECNLKWLNEASKKRWKELKNK